MTRNSEISLSIPCRSGTWHYKVAITRLRRNQTTLVEVTPSRKILNQPMLYGGFH